MLDNGRRVGKKGQMFLIGAVVIVASMVIIKINMVTPYAIREREILESRFENEIFENIQLELNNTIRFSYDNPTSITDNVFDFANFTEYKMMGHSVDFEFLYVGIITNHTISRMNVSLVNMLDSTIDANFTVGTQSKNTAGIIDYEKWDNNFTTTPGNNYNLVLTYNSTSGDIGTRTSETISIDTKKNKDTYIGFFYIVITSEDAVHVAKHQKMVVIH